MANDLRKNVYVSGLTILVKFTQFTHIFVSFKVYVHIPGVGLGKYLNRKQDVPMSVFLVKVAHTIHPLTSFDLLIKYPFFIRHDDVNVPV